MRDPTWSSVMQPHPLLAVVLLAAAAGAQTVLPPFNTAWSVDDLGTVPGVGSYGGVAFRHDDPDRLLYGAYGSTRIVSVPLVRNALGRVVGFGAFTVHASVGGADGGLAYGPGNVLFHTWYGPNRLGQIRPGETTAARTIDLGPLGVSGSVGACAFPPAGHPAAGRLKLVSYATSLWYEATLVADGNGTWSIAALSPGLQLAGGPEGIAYPPAGAPMLGGKVLVAEWNGPGIAVYDANQNGDPIPGTRQTVVTGISGNAGGAVDPRTGDIFFSGGGGRLYALRATAVCGSAGSYGVGTPGLNGVPSLQAAGCPRLGQEITLRVASGRPAAFGALAMGFWPANLQVHGVTILTSSMVSLTHVLDTAGGFQLTLPIPVDPRYGDLHLYFQAGYLDAAAAQGFSATAGLDLLIR